jgi:hypothetical protein
MSGGSDGQTNGRVHAEGAAERLARLTPGETVELPERGERGVVTAYACYELLNEQRTDWRWLFLDDGSLLELAPRGRFLYSEHREVPHGGSLYEELVAQDGALVRFEARVRDGSWAERPVQVTLDNTAYRLAFTGTVALERRGPEPLLSAWRALGPDPEHNVYFGLIQIEDDTRLVLGLWTADVCLSFGERLADESGSQGAEGTREPKA